MLRKSNQTLGYSGSTYSQDQEGLHSLLYYISGLVHHTSETEVGCESLCLWYSLRVLEYALGLSYKDILCQLPTAFPYDKFKDLKAILDDSSVAENAENEGETPSSCTFSASDENAGVPTRSTTSSARPLRDITNLHGIPNNKEEADALLRKEGYPLWAIKNAELKPLELAKYLAQFAPEIAQLVTDFESKYVDKERVKLTDSGPSYNFSLFGHLGDGILMPQEMTAFPISHERIESELNQIRCRLMTDCIALLNLHDFNNHMMNDGHRTSYIVRLFAIYALGSEIALNYGNEKQGQAEKDLMGEGLLENEQFFCFGAFRKVRNIIIHCLDKAELMAALMAYFNDEDKLVQLNSFAILLLKFVQNYSTTPCNTWLRRELVSFYVSDSESLTSFIDDIHDYFKSVGLCIDKVPDVIKKTKTVDECSIALMESLRMVKQFVWTIARLKINVSMGSRFELDWYLIALGEVIQSILGKSKVKSHLQELIKSLPKEYKREVDEIFHENRFHNAFEPILKDIVDYRNHAIHSLVFDDRERTYETIRSQARFLMNLIDDLIYQISDIVDRSQEQAGRAIVMRSYR